MRIKIFHIHDIGTSEYGGLETQVNKWLSENHVEVTHVVQSESNYKNIGLHFTLTIFYKPASRCL